jgi:Iap family predicted aminopeptidase
VSPETPRPLSPQTIETVVRDLVAVGNRFVGTPGEQAARERVREAFGRVGLANVREEPVQALAYTALGARLALADDGAELPAFGLQFTAAGDVEADAVFLGRPAHVDDIAELESAGCRISGRIAVIQSFWPFGFAPFLEQRGAVGIVVVSENPPGQTGHYTAQLYPPAEPPDFRGSPLPVPGVTVDLAVGQRLVALLSAGRTRLRLGHDAGYRPVLTANVVGEVPGTSRPDEWVVVGAHYDTQLDGVGACDNASGVAAVVATAERWAVEPAARTGVFAAFAGEEHGFFGSISFCRRHRDALRRTVLMLNFDALAWKGAWGRSLWVDRAIEQLALERLAEAGWSPDEVVEASAFPASDHTPFIDAGVPALWPWRYPPQHPCYHAAGDDLGMLDWSLLVDTARAGAHVARSAADDLGLEPRPSTPARRWLDFG